MAETAGSTTKTTARKRTTTPKATATRRSTAGKKAATTRARKTTASNVRTAERRTERAAERRAEGVEGVVAKATETVQRTVLTGVGAVFVARDGVVELRTKYDTPKKAGQELRKLERRGRTAVSGFERDVRKARTAVERELRQRRERVDVAVAQAQNVVQSGVLAGAQAAARVTDRL